MRSKQLSLTLRRSGVIRVALDIQITDSARDKINNLIEEKNLKDHYLRLSIKGGGCSGFTYEINFTDRTDKYDKTDELNGMKIVVDSKSYLYLKGMTIDYTDTLMYSGFVFTNPNAKTTCGCGTSFNA
jgi:iron-sulfur cluster assembly protein